MSAVGVLMKTKTTSSVCLGMCVPKTCRHPYTAGRNMEKKNNFPCSLNSDCAWSVNAFSSPSSKCLWEAQVLMVLFKYSLPVCEDHFRMLWFNYITNRILSRLLFLLQFSHLNLQTNCRRIGSFFVEGRKFFCSS